MRYSQINIKLIQHHIFLDNIILLILKYYRAYKDYVNEKIQISHVNSGSDNTAKSDIEVISG